MLTFRDIPSVHTFLENESLQELLEFGGVGRSVLYNEITNYIEGLKTCIKNGEQFDLSFDDMIKDINAKVHKVMKNKLNPVINATGVVLHTNLGRAVLSKSAIDNMIKVAEGYSNLEYNISNGKRGSRHDIVEEVLIKLTGAESAMVVNNNAAAVFLILNEMAKNKEVIVSRGQLVEIGGSFRISSIMEESGAFLKEVGTTNKTHEEDYIRAINDQTGLLLKVHTSNFKTIGFTKEVESSELVLIGKEHNVPVYEDLGSGVLFDLKKFGVGDEPLVQDAIKNGVDIVSFSGDKLLGGPQAGIIVGKKEFINRLKKNQLARVLRIDKMTLAALETTLKMYLNDKATDIPTIRDIIATKEEILKKTVRVIDILDMVKEELEIDYQVQSDKSAIGGGTLPGIEIDTQVLSISSKNISVNDLEKKLRYHSIPVIARIKNNELILDFRTIQENEVLKLSSILIELFTKKEVDNHE